MLWAGVIAVVGLWTLGFGFAEAAIGTLVHIVLILALVILIFQFVRERRA